MASWVQSAGYIASDPARVAVLIGLAQAGRPLDDMSVTQAAGMLYQQIAGQPLETAILLRHVHDLAEHGLLERDDSGFRWRTTPLGLLVSRQWASGAFDPPGSNPLGHDEVRAWRDRLLAQLEEDATLADQAGVSREELLAGNSLRISELRVLNRVIAEDRFPEWLRAMQGE